MVKNKTKQAKKPEYADPEIAKTVKAYKSVRGIRMDCIVAAVALLVMAIRFYATNDFTYFLELTAVNEHIIEVFHMFILYFILIAALMLVLQSVFRVPLKLEAATSEYLSKYRRWASCYKYIEYLSSLSATLCIILLLISLHYESFLSRLFLVFLHSSIEVTCILATVIFLASYFNRKIAVSLKNEAKVNELG